MAMGQAAGVVAALGAQHEIAACGVPSEEIRTHLRERGAIVPVTCDE